MTELAHIRDEQIVRRYSGEPPSGWVVWADGSRTSPPQAGMANGTERVVVIERVTNDTSITDFKVKTVAETIEANRVLVETVIRDKSQAELDAQAEAQKNNAAETLDVAPEFKALAIGLFELVNEVRTLKGQQPITPTQFKNYLRNKM